MKQKIAWGLGIFYLVSVIGLALNFHFCGGKLINVQLFSNEHSCKFCGIKKEMPDCCKNTQLHFKVKDDHQAETSIKLAKLFSTDVFLPNLFTETVSFSTPLTVSLCENKAPPKVKKIGIYLLNCVFRT